MSAHSTTETCLSGAVRGELTYPHGRPRYWALRYIRLLNKTCVANQLGQDVFTLLTTIAAVEDAKRYRGPVTFHTGQLLPIVGFAKWERLDAARTAAVSAGWLHYSAPPGGSRRPGEYWCIIPSEVDATPDSPLDDEQDAFARGYHIGYADGTAGRPPQAYPSDGYCSDAQSPAGGYGQGDGEGYGEGYGQGELPYRTRTRKSARTFVAPTIEEVAQYVEEAALRMDAGAFHDHFNACGWLVGGRSPMKDWRAAARNWARRESAFNRGNGKPSQARHDDDSDIRRGRAILEELDT